MKSFFKKLSLVLAAAMVITMLPLQSAKAVTKVNLGVDATKAAAGETIELEVGATQKIGFYGVKDYNTAGAKTKVWKSDNTSVATVTNAFVTAVAPGTANISFTCTNNGIDYAGSVKVVVKTTGTAAQTQGNVSVKQTAYNAVEVTFADKAAASAAKDKILVERVKTSGKGGTFYLSVNATKNADEEKVTITGLSDQVTYRITVPGVAKPFVVSMSIGPAADLILEYPTVYIGTGVDIVGNNVKNPTVTPVVKIVDADGKVTADAVKNVKYSTDKTKNQYATFTAGSGKIKFSSLSGVCYVKATYTYKDAQNVSHTLTDELSVSPVAYVAPSLQGFVEQICLTDKTGKDIVYPTTYDFTGTLAVGEKKAIAYYFETPEGAKYAGKNVKDTVVYTDGSKKISELNDKDYILYFVKDDASANVISLYNFGNKTEVRGWNEGTERVCLYKQLGTSQQPLTDTLVGVIDITVKPEPYVFDMQLSDNAAEGYTNGITRTQELTYALIDQYGNAIGGELVIKGTDGSNVPSVTYEAKADKKGEGKIIVNFETLGPTTEAKDVVVSVKGTEYSETISISAEKIVEDSSDLGYDLILDNLEVKNKDFYNVTNIDALGVNIKVAETRDGNRLKYVDFVVTSDDVDETIPNVITEGTLVLVLSNADDAIVKEDARTEIVTMGNAARIGANAAEGYTFDVFPNATAAAATAIGDVLKVGAFTANLYKVTGANKGNFDLQSSVEFTVSNNMELIQNIDNTYKLKADDNKVKRTGTAKADLTWTEDDEKAYVVTSEEQYKVLMATIVGQLYGWFDINSDGKATDDEVDRIADLFPGFKVIDQKYVAGAENNEVFVKTVTIQYKLQKDPAVAGPLGEQTIVINRKFKH